MGRKRKTEDVRKIYKIPESLKLTLREYLDSISGKKLSNLQYWNHLELINTISGRQHIEPDGFVSLDSQVLKQSLGSRYKDWIANLLKLGILEYKRDEEGRPEYSKLNHHAIKYRFTDTFSHEDLVDVEGAKRIHKSKRRKSIIDANTKRLLSNVGYPEYAFLRDNLFKINIDMEAVLAESNMLLERGAFVKDELYTQAKHNCYIYLCQNLNEDFIKFHLSNGNRIITDFALSPTIMRKFTRVDGYTGVLYHSDLSAAHILLAMPLLKEYQANLTSSVNKSEIDKVISMVASKKFYLMLSNELRGEGVNIADEKTDFFQYIWTTKYINSHSNNPYRKAFQKLYPTFFNFIKSQHQRFGNNAGFANELTKRESNLFNNRIANRVVTELGKETFLAGIYDSFIYKEEDKEAIERIMEEEVVRLTGITGMVKTTTLNEESDKKVRYPNQESISSTKEVVIKNQMAIEIAPDPIVRTQPDFTHMAEQDYFGWTLEAATGRVKLEYDALFGANAFNDLSEKEQEIELFADRRKWIEELKTKIKKEAARGLQLELSEFILG